MGKLVQVATETVTSPVASVTLTGIDSDDVYMIAFNNIQETVDNEHLRWRVTESGTPNTTANYDWAGKGLNTTTTFFNQASTNQTYFNSQMALGTATGEVANGIIYIYNANNSSEYTFCTVESTSRNASGDLLGRQGGNVLTVASEVDGVQFYYVGGNIDTGSTFTLYGLKK